MIFKRFAANLRAQNWFAIAIELAIVIVGVFIGTWSPIGTRRGANAA